MKKPKLLKFHLGDVVETTDTFFQGYQGVVVGYNNKIINVEFQVLGRYYEYHFPEKELILISSDYKPVRLVKEDANVRQVD